MDNKNVRKRVKTLYERSLYSIHLYERFYSKKKSPEGLYFLIIPAADDRVAEMFVVQGFDDAEDRDDKSDDAEYDKHRDTDQEDDEET